MNLFLLAQNTAAGTAVPELMPSVWRVLFALVVVLGLLGGLAWMLKRGVLTRRGTGSLAIETALALGERRSLVVVTVEGRRLLLGLAPHNVSLVTELAPAASFDAVVSKAIAKDRLS